MSGIQLFIDNREDSLLRLFDNNKKTYVKECLDLGDIVIRNNKQINIIIERKSINDLCSSITDGRHREQKMRLLNSGIPIHKILYIIEGDISNINKFTHINKQTLISSLINTQFRDKIKVYKTKDINETFEFICKLYDKYIKQPEIFDAISTSNTEEQYVSTLNIKKKLNKTPSVVFMAQLCIIPQLSPVISKQICEKYKNMRLLIDAYNLLENEKDRQEMLSNICYPIKNNKQRRLGSKLSNNIYKLIYQEYD
jgi:crossover junction endonuclease MUS81